MGAIEMIKDICSSGRSCGDCPFNVDNILTPDEIKQIGGSYEECYLSFAPDSWDTDRIIETAETVHKESLGYFKVKSKEPNEKEEKEEV